MREYRFTRLAAVGVLALQCICWRIQRCSSDMCNAVLHVVSDLHPAVFGVSFMCHRMVVLSTTAISSCTASVNDFQPSVGSCS